MYLTSRSESPARAGSWSLALRLTAWYVGSSFVILLVATLALYLILANNVRQEQDQFLADKVRVLREILRHRANETFQLNEEVEQTWAPRQYARVYARVLDSDGRIMVESPQMDTKVGGHVFPPPAPPGVEPGEGAPFLSTNGKEMRAVSALALTDTSETKWATIQVALDTERSHDLMAGYRQTLLMVLLLGLAACAITGYLLGRAGLRPLRRIASTAERVRSSNLNERIKLAGLPAELSSVALRFNEMLDRLEDAFIRLSRFSADIAHELRTPVNNMRLETEVALGKARSLDEYRETLGSCLEECERLSRIIDSMLFIARSEDPRTQITRESIDIGQELERVREFYEAPAADAGVEITVACDHPTRAAVDRTLFQRAVGNLVANAIRYTPRGGRIELAAARENGQLRIDVADTGEGIAPEDLPHIFDRFYRADRARTNTASANVGLGLPIVKSIVSLHGGTIQVDSKPHHGTRMTIRIPATADHAQPRDAMTPHSSSVS